MQALPNLQTSALTIKRNDPSSSASSLAKCVGQMPMIICIMDRLYAILVGLFFDELWSTLRNLRLVNLTMVDKSVKWHPKRDLLVLTVDFTSAWKWECNGNGWWPKWTKKIGKRKMSWLKKWERKIEICRWQIMKVEWGKVATNLPQNWNRLSPQVKMLCLCTFNVTIVWDQLLFRKVFLKERKGQCNLRNITGYQIADSWCHSLN